MNIVAVLLVTLWLASLVFDFTLGGLIHLLALAVVWIVFTTGNHAPRRA